MVPCVILYKLAKIWRLNLVSRGNYGLGKATHLLMTNLLFNLDHRCSKIIDDFLDCRAALLICHAASLKEHQALVELVIVFPDTCLELLKPLSIREKEFLKLGDQERVGECGPSENVATDRDNVDDFELVVELQELLHETLLHCLENVSLAILFKVVDAESPVLEVSLGEQVLVLQKEVVHSALNLVITDKSEGLRESYRLDHIDVADDVFRLSHFLVSQEIPLEKNEERSLRVGRELALVRPVQGSHNGEVPVDNEEGDLEVVVLVCLLLVPLQKVHLELLPEGLILLCLLDHRLLKAQVVGVLTQ